MKQLRAGVCVVLLLASLGLPSLGETDIDKADIVRDGLKIAGAAMGLVGGSVFSLRISLELLEAPALDAAALALPVAAVGAVTGAWAGGWMAGVALRGRPGPLLAIAEGAGLGLLAGIFVGASTISTCAVLSFPRLLDRFDDLDEAGTASTPEISSPSDVLGYVSLAVFLGGGRGAGIGLISGAILFPLVSLYMGF